MVSILLLQTGTCIIPWTWKEVTQHSLSWCGTPRYHVLTSSMSLQRPTKIMVCVSWPMYNIVLIEYDVYGITGMITKCLWRGQPINCAAIFRMQPTDQGMCCSFNKEKAEEMFMEGRYKEHLVNMIAQDENQAMGDSQLPEWWDTLLNYKFIQRMYEIRKA